MVIIETASQPIKSLSHFNVQSAVKAAAILFPPALVMREKVLKREIGAQEFPQEVKEISLKSSRPPTIISANLYHTQLEIFAYCP
jgi:hypothetical protein